MTRGQLKWTAGLAVVLLCTIFVEQTEGDRRQPAGFSRCVFGPSYWCSDLKKSAECGATKHCISQVWTKQPAPVDDDDICKICKDMVRQARDQLESNETQEELKEVFEGSCKLLPIKIIANECIKLVDDFIPELVETLASEMNPDTVCTVSGLCNSVRIDKLIMEYKMKMMQRIRQNFPNRFQQRRPRISSDCDVCHEETRKISHRLETMGKQKVLDKALELCGRYMSSFSDACKITVVENFDELYEALIHLEDGVCELTGMCSESNIISPKYTIATTGGDDLECQFCQKVLQHWIDTWKANTTEEEFRQVLEAICHHLKNSERQKRCLHIVDDYYIPLFNYFLNELNPKLACEAVGLCGHTATGFLSGEDDVSISLLLPRDSTEQQQNLARPQEETSYLGVESPNQYNQHRVVGGYFAPQSIVQMKTPGCAICEFVLHRLQEYLRDEKTQDAVERGLKKVCHDMPSSLKDQCSQLVQTYGPAIIELIAYNVEPDEVCTHLHLCKQERGFGNEVGELAVGSDNPIVAMKKKNDNCATCHYVVHIVMENVEDKYNQNEIRNVLESLCTLLPSETIQTKCEEFVDKYTEKLIELITDNLSEDMICEALKMCDAKPSKGEGCVICEYAVTTLDSMLEDKTNEEEVKEALDKLCSYLPKSVTKQCVTFVDTYTDELIDLITQGLTPDQVCQELGLCPTNNEEGLLRVRLVKEELEGERPYCTLCEYAIGEVDKVIEDKHNEAAVKEALERVCYELSQPITKECVNLIDTYLDVLVQMFVDDFTPQQICAEIGLCHKTTIFLPSSLNEIPEMEDEYNDDDSSEEEDDSSEEVEDTAGDALQTQTMVEGGPVCVLCEFAMSILEKQIITNRTLDIVERAVLMVCSYMPGSIADECENFVEKYGDEIIHLIVELETDPKEVCAALGVCAESKLWDATFVGGRKCAWGPAMWCQSNFHSYACGTIEYCKRKGANQIQY